MRPYLGAERRLVELPESQQGEALQSVYVFLTVANLQTFARNIRWLNETILAADKYASKYPTAISWLGLVNKGDVLRAQGKLPMLQFWLSQCSLPRRMD